MGWLRNMYYSLSQQLMRQDPAYYIAYVALYPNSAWCLMSYLYYTKYIVISSNTTFKYININIPYLITNRQGYNIIQGLLSINNKVKGNYTIILLGMH